MLEPVGYKPVKGSLKVSRCGRPGYQPELFLAMIISLTLYNTCLQALSWAPMGFLDTNEPAFAYVFHSSSLVLPAGHHESGGSHTTTTRTAGATEAPPSTLLRLDPCSPQPQSLNTSDPETQRKEGVDQTQWSYYCGTFLATSTDVSPFPHQICLDIFTRRRKRETISTKGNPSLSNISPTKAPTRKRAVLFYELKVHCGCSSLLGIGDVDTMDLIQKLVLLY